MIRITTPDDAPEMLDIYKPFVLNSGVTQEVEPPSETAFAKRIKTGLQNFPWLVYLHNGKIVGYAYASRYRDRAGYQWSAESSVYISDSFYGKGIAKKLYTALFGFLKLQGYFNIYAVITLPNDRSIAFHKNFGFEYFTTYKNAGYKLNKWHDVGWMVFTAQPHINNPLAPLPFNNFSPEKIRVILNMVNK